MSFDFNGIKRALSPQPPQVRSPPPPTSLELASPPPRGRSPGMSPGSIASPGGGRSPDPSTAASSSFPAEHPLNDDSSSAPHVHQHSPVDLFQRVDPRYPDIIATLSNALHYLNKSGFDHDQRHHHADTASDDDASSRNSYSDNTDPTQREPFAVRIDENDFGTEEGDLADGLVTPGVSDSEDEEGSDEEDRRRSQPPRSPSGDLDSGTTQPLSSSSASSSSHVPHHGHRRSRSAMGSHSDALSNHAEVDEARDAPHDSQFQQSKAAVVPTEYPEVQSVSPPVVVDHQSGEDPFSPVQPEHGQTAPAKSSTFPSSHSADLVARDSSSSPTDHATAASNTTAVTGSGAPYVGKIVSITGQPLPPREAAILAGPRRAHRHTASEVAQFLSPHTNSHSPSSPSPISPRSPTGSPRPRSLSTSAAAPSPHPSSSPRRSAASTSSPTGMPAPPGSVVDVQESTKTETSEQTTESETDSTKTVIVTTTTVTTHIVTKTTTVQKSPAPTDSAVVWTKSEQSELLEEILLFYVDLYWENQHSFAPFYKQKTDTWRDKALMIYRHLFQDEKFKSQSKKLLKAPLVDFFEEQLTKKAQMARAPMGRPMMKGSGDMPGLTSPVSETHNHSVDPPAAMASPTVSPPQSAPSSGSATPSSLQPPTAGSPPGKRRSSFSLPNPLALFSPSPKEPTPEEIEIEAYLSRVNHVCGELHKQFFAVSGEINRQIVDHLLTPELPSHITCANDLNRAMVSLLHAPQILSQLSVYHPMYQDAVVNFPGRVLMSRTLRHRIESPSFLEFNFTDMIVAVNELTEILRKAFQKLASNHPHLIQNLVSSKRLLSLRDLHAASSAERERKRDKGGYAESFSSWLYDSRVYPKLFTPSTFHILQSLHIHDARTFHHLSEHRLQEALWRLKELGHVDDANTLERLINDEILGDAQANIADVENLGGGFTTTKLINFPTQDVRGVYKPKSGPIFSANFKLQTMKDSLVSNYKKEIAAYKIDKLLQLNHVPITKLTEYHGEKGSLQYFIADANVARMLNDVDINNPHKSGKWSNSRGRAELPRSIKMFDWFINNRDRNLDNYLISDDGRVILIDHGWTFVAPTTAPTKDFLKKLIPKESIYNNVKALHENQRLIDEELKELLGPRNLQAFKNRLKTFVHFVEKRINKKGREETFREAEIEDWKPDLS